MKITKSNGTRITKRGRTGKEDDNMHRRTRTKYELKHENNEKTNEDETMEYNESGL
jgi:hypothetical protein